MMGELRVRVPYCVESCEVPKKRTAPHRTAALRRLPGVGVCRRAHGALHTAAAPAPAPEQLLRHAILACLRFCRARKGRDRGQTPALALSLPLCLSARCLPKEEWPNLRSAPQKNAGKASDGELPSHSRGGPTGIRGLSAPDPRKAFQVRKAPAAVQMPKAASPSWPSLRPSVPMAQRASEPCEPTGPSPSTNSQGCQAGKARKPERRPLISITRLNSSEADLHY